MRAANPWVVRGTGNKGTVELCAAEEPGSQSVGCAQQIRLPELIAEFGFELLVGGLAEQWAGREAALLEEAIEGGGGDRRRRVIGTKSEFAQQGSAGAVLVLTLEAFDEVGELGGEGAESAAILAGLGR